jgi:hypothetical protein
MKSLYCNCICSGVKRDLGVGGTPVTVATTGTTGTEGGEELNV